MWQLMQNKHVRWATLTLFRPTFFYSLKVQGNPLTISGTIKASQMKPCTVIVLLKAFQNTKRKNQEILPITPQWRHY